MEQWDDFTHTSFMREHLQRYKPVSGDKTMDGETAHFLQLDGIPTLRPKEEKDEGMSLEPGTVWNLEREFASEELWL